MSNQYSLERLADRAEIQDVLHLWTRSMDRLDYEGMRKVFHPDAIDSHGPYEGGVEGLIDWIRDRHQNIPFSLHSLSNILIEFTNSDSAIVESVVTCVQHYPEVSEAVIHFLGGGKEGVPLDMIAFARYVDQFERKSGSWRIQHRQVVMDSRMVVESGSSSFADGLMLGRRDQDDYIFRLRREVGLYL